MTHIVELRPRIINPLSQIDIESDTCLKIDIPSKDGSFTIKDIFKGIAEKLIDNPYVIFENEEAFGIISKKKISLRDKIINVGETLYQEIKTTLEKKFKNKFVAIDVENQKVVVIGDTTLETLKKARKLENKRYYIRKIGRLPLLG